MSSMPIRLFQPDDAPDELTVPNIVRLYLAWLEKRVANDDFSAENLANFRRELNWFADAFPLRISDCRQRDLEVWIERNPQWESAHMKKGVIARIVACFNWAADHQRGDLIDRSPYSRIRAISMLPYVPRRPATHAEYTGLMSDGCLEFRNAIFFLFGTGTRPCEMRTLIWPYVQFDAIVPHLNYARHKTYRQVRKPKLVGLSNEMVSFLRDLYKRRDPKKQNVFLNTAGKPWQQRAFASHLRDVAARAGLDEGVIKKVSAGCFRTTFACDGIKSGFTNREVADMLGHESTHMVDHVYGAQTREDSQHLDDMAKRMAMKRKMPE